MIIVSGNAPDGSTQKREKTFTGEVWADPVLPTTDGVTINTIVFPPGSRTFWHHHENGQILEVIAGRGLICSKGEQPRELHVGDIVWVPPGEQHWHGAAQDSMLSHIAISLGTTHWADEVAEADAAPTHTPRDAHAE